MAKIGDGYVEFAWDFLGQPSVLVVALRLQSHEAGSEGRGLVPQHP